MSLSSVSSLSTLLSKANKYTWSFGVDYNKPSNISVFAFSVEEARQEVLAKLHEISILSPEYNRVQQERWTHASSSLEHTELTKKRDALLEQINIDINTGSFCPSVFEYAPTMLVTSYPSFEEITLEKLVSETEPSVSKINTMSVYSCLDG
jgi:hypothetical protein